MKNRFTFSLYLGLPGDIYQSDRVSHVLLNGRLYEAGNLNEVLTGARKTEPFYWQR